MKRLRTAVIPWVVIGVTLSATVGLHDALEGRRQTREARDAGAAPSFYLPRGDLLRILSLGFRQLFADVYWFRLIQAIGSNTHGFPYVDEYTEQITDLDPRNAPAYLMANFWLLTRFQFEDANRILEKGKKAFPQEWKFPYYLGLNHYLFLRDKGSAMPAFREALARIQAHQSSPMSEGEARRVFSDPEHAFAWFKQHHGELELGHDEERAAMLSFIRHADFHQIVMDRIPEAQRCHREATGHEADELQALVAVGCLEAVPADPYGGRLYLDGERKVRSSRIRGDYWWERGRSGTRAHGGAETPAAATPAAGTPAAEESLS